MNPATTSTDRWVRRLNQLGRAMDRRARERAVLPATREAITLRARALAAPRGGGAAPVRRPYQTKRKLIAHQLETRAADYRAYAVVLGSPEPDDLVARAFAKAVVAHRSYDRRRPIDVWLRAIMRHAWIDERRSRRFTHERPLFEAFEPRGRDLPPEAALERAEAVAAVRRALYALPRAMAWAVRACDLRGRGLDEAARRAGVPAGTIRSRLSRGRAALAQRLESFA